MENNSLADLKVQFPAYPTNIVGTALRMHQIYQVP